jgi:predicted DNA-binding transcriptional regulator AlpA
MTSGIEMVSPMENLLTVELLASKIHKSVTSIRSDVARNPKSLPPICRLPGTKRLLWREEDVSKWIAKHVCTTLGSDFSGIQQTWLTRERKPSID